MLEAVRLPGCYELMVGLCDRLVAGGVKLHRANMFGLRLHPEVRAISSIWRRDGSSEDQPVPYDDSHLLPVWQLSPLKRIIMDGAGEIRRRIAPELQPFEFPVLDDLLVEGCSDYLCLPLIFSDHQRSTISFVTTAPNGFSDAELDLLRSLMPILTTVAELILRRHLAEVLLNTYLGKGPGKEVLSGGITRGGHRVIEAAILVADLRDFSTLSNRMPTDQIVRLLNWFFDITVAAVMAQGGEVLKFIGDGLLAIFPVSGPMTARLAAAAALAAAQIAEARLRDEVPPIALDEVLRDAPIAGFGLHLGPVVYGNIGASGRLDFTAIGTAVNLTTRLEALTRRLDQPILISPALADQLTGRCRILGDYDLKGFTAPIGVFAPM